jgi:transposase-like protein
MPAPFPPEFKRRAVQMARDSDKSVTAVARELGVSPSALRNWIGQADIDEGRKPGLSSQDRSELAELRREKFRLQTENEILRRAAAFFAREIDPK